MTDRLYFTPDDEANALLARNPVALLVGFALDQQVPVPKAFMGPRELERRLGTLDPHDIAGMELGRLEEVFRERPAIHRFPGTMAKRVQDLCAALVSDYDGDAARVWRDATSGEDLYARLLGLPSIGEMKAKSLVAILRKRFDLDLPGLEDVVPDHPTLGDVDSPEALVRYQAWKRDYKASRRSGS